MSNEKKFEDNLNELEKIVSQLESGKIPLEDCLHKFEKGVELYKACKIVLDNAEKKISILTKELKEKDYLNEKV